jgi:hypothetical protein
MLDQKFNDRALRTREGVVELMSGSNSQRDWDKNCDAVVAANYGHYPTFWYDAVEEANLYAKTSRNFNP